MTGSGVNSLSLVVPCYNEEEAIPLLAERITELCASLSKREIEAEIIIVDDGSQDCTWDVLQKEFKKVKGTVLCRHEVNSGFGSALKTGLTRAGGDVVVTVDADTNYDLRLAPEMLHFFEAGYDIVTASPFAHGGACDYPIHRYVLSKTVAWLYRYALGADMKPLSVYTCGFRAYRNTVVSNILPDADDFLATSQALIKGLLLGYEIAEMPVKVHPRLHGHSKMKFVRTAFRHIKFLWSLKRRKYVVIRNDDPASFSVI
ncbi:glycosyltransferase family 2 protein [Magnetovibrio sp. PR-2]|uniref:glycosyltransferase family 2 protein n=1 Tax=Magnetovibrio sp. PR-2 TaxID=3120356 RepID=UPI002FCE664A